MRLMRCLPIGGARVNRCDQQNKLRINAEFFLDRHFDDEAVIGDYDAVDCIHRRFQVVIYIGAACRTDVADDRRRAAAFRPRGGDGQFNKRTQTHGVAQGRPITHNELSGQTAVGLIFLGLRRV